MSKIPGLKGLPLRAAIASPAVAAMSRGSLTSHILPTAATMVGACMTVLSIGRLTHTGRLGVVVDKMLAFDSVLFLVSAVLSFVAIRKISRPERLEAWAEEMFLIGLLLSALVAVLIAFAIDL